MKRATEIIQHFVYRVEWVGSKTAIRKTPMKKTIQNSLCLGIDTGGTYTDGVILDLSTQKVVQSAKVLTTHYDLKVCIGEIFERLIPDDPDVLSFISLSTTLATNAIAEGKRRDAALFLLGYDAELIYNYQLQNRFGTNYFFFINGKHGMDGREVTALDEEALSLRGKGVLNVVDALAIASYSGARNADHERRAADILSQETGLPVVQAHHLANDLDSVRRATTASLNASLLGNLHEFIRAVEEMLDHHRVSAPLLMVRGDGSIVKAQFAQSRPVEIIHSGPATSAIGGQFLADVQTGLVIDIGGTTTDITLVDEAGSSGAGYLSETAATVGPYRTCVKTIQARSIGLGGDSFIHFDRHGTLSIGPERVQPLAYLSYHHPQVKEDLSAYLAEKESVQSSTEIEYWSLRREPVRPIQDERTRKAIHILKDGPMRLRQLLKLVGVVSPVQIDQAELINREIIERSTLTPTDLLHASGTFSEWDADIALKLVEAVSRTWHESAEAFIQRVHKVITRRIVAETIQFLSGKTLSEPGYHSKDQRIDLWLFEQNLENSNPYLGSEISLKIPLIGIGAPAQAFLPAVAEALRTTCIFPDNYQVANAVGTVVGSVVVKEDAEVSPIVEGHAITGYFARVNNQQIRFEKYSDAVDFARENLRKSVYEGAVQRGAAAVRVEISENESEHQIMRLSGWAAGKPETGPA